MPDDASPATDPVEARLTAPLCQAGAALFEDFGFLEEVGMEAAAGVEDFDADKAVVFPVERDESADSGWQAGLDGGAAGCERVAGEVDVDGVRRGVVGDPHASIVPCRSHTSWRYTWSDSLRLRQRNASLGVLPSVRLRS